MSQRLPSGFWPRKSQPPRLPAKLIDDGEVDSDSRPRQPRSQEHIFDCHKNQNVTPSWFFEDALKDDAEELLLKGTHFGNVLLRPSGSFHRDGTYIISSRAGERVCHDRVLDLPDGFLIDKEGMDGKHHCCLTAVMTHFLSTSDVQFQLFGTNDWSLILNGPSFLSADGSKTSN